MPSAFFGLEIARKALAMSQLNLQVIAHNISNAGTPGYSRQRAELVTPSPLAYPAFTRPGFVQQLGTGVEVESVKRIRDEFLDEIIRAQTGSQGRNSTVDAALKNIELIFNEPGEQTLSTILDNFFAAWQDLANNPELVSTRANLREQTISLVREIKSFDTALKRLKSEQYEQMKLAVKNVNTTAKQIADLNIQIAQITGLGDDPNDLKDQRDLLIEEIAKVVPISTIEQSNGSMSVLIGGLRLVEDDKVHELEFTSSLTVPDSFQIKFKNGNIPNFSGRGVISGLIEVHSKIIPYFQNRINTLATSLVNRVNVQHRKGFGLDGSSNRPFFADYRTSEMNGTFIFPTGTSLNTTIDTLGITAGTFTIQGTEIKISPEDVAPGESITLGELLTRITDSQPYVRAELAFSYNGDPFIKLNLYNPEFGTDKINIFEGTSNFLSLTGLLGAESTYTTEAQLYSNSASMFGISLLVMENLDVIAAAGDDGSGVFSGPGNNLNALAIAGLQYNVSAIKGTTFGDYYVSTVGELGSQAQTMARLVTNQDILLNQLSVQRESISGVNLDEEATNMITYQRIYEGAARVIQVVDSMLDTLINRTGA